MKKKLKNFDFIDLKCIFIRIVFFYKTDYTLVISMSDLFF